MTQETKDFLLGIINEGDWNVRVERDERGNPRERYEIVVTPEEGSDAIYSLIHLMRIVDGLGLSAFATSEWGFDKGLFVIIY